MERTLLAYGPSLTTMQLQALAERAQNEKFHTVYVQELAASRLPPSLRRGMLASLPFAGLMPEQLLFMGGRAQELGCNSFTFALPGGWIRDGRYAETTELLQSLQKQVSIRLVPTLILAQLDLDHLREAMQLCFSVGIETLCLGTGTNLDSVDAAAIECAQDMYRTQKIPLHHLEIASTEPLEGLEATNRICISQTSAEASSY
ncbi:hypothetical protein SDC9_63327 [bioreactor metagenome]|jgi:hypothetical protein|uniref:Uncharacterized protein n=1 Tax=bioreactor metagenome TaxID=1076179 RepID=A0A644XL86_9ZZZZ|nr:hypothetical protein [Sphaerochaeta sp.]